MRRMVLIFLHFTVQTGYSHPHLNEALKNYAIFIQAWKGHEKIRSAIRSLRHEAGLPEPQFREILAKAFG